MLDDEIRKLLKEEAELIPEGFRRMVLAEVELTVSSAGNDMLVFDFETADPWNKKRVRDYAVLRIDLLWKLAQIYNAFSADADETSPDDLIGKTVLAKIVHEARDGMIQAKIVGYLPDQEAQAAA